jgi:Cys-rich protein (TIGR01571 family)
MIYAAACIGGNLFGMGGILSGLIQMIGRGNIRAKFNIEGSSFNDCCATFCCSACALTQEAREINEMLHLKS